MHIHTFIILTSKLEENNIYSFLLYLELKKKKIKNEIDKKLFNKKSKHNFTKLYYQ